MGKDDKGKKEVAEIKKHRALIQSSNNIDLRQRKAFNAMLFIAKEQLEKNPNQEWFSYPIPQLKKLISEKKNFNNIDLRKSLLELMRIIIEFNLLEDERFKCWEAMPLVYHLRETDTGFIEFLLPKIIRENVLKPEIFCFLDLKIMAKFESKFSIAIYEFCKDYIKVEMPKLEMEVFKKMVGIEKMYPRIYDLRKRVLDPSVEEISEKTDIKVEYDLIIKNRAVTHIKFYAKKKEEYYQETTISEPNKGKSKTAMSDTDFLTKIIALIPEYEILTTKETTELKELTNKHGEEIVVSNIKYTNRQNYQNYFVYLRKAIAEDYAEKDRKINEMKADERKVYEQKVKDEEAGANQRETQRKQAIRIYQTLPDEEREAIEIEAEKALEKLEGIEKVKKLKLMYENMKLSKIVELVTAKYLGK